MTLKNSDTIDIDGNTQSNLDTKGFALFNIDFKVIDKLASYISEILEAKKIKEHYSGLCYSLILFNSIENRVISSQLRSILKTAVNKAYPGFSIYCCSFIIKPQTDQTLSFHQDWNYALANDHPTYTVWIPLSSVNMNNGALKIIENSQTINNNNYSGSLNAIRVENVSDFITINMEKGEGIAFNPLLFHGSHKNEGGLRIAVTFILKPKGQPLKYFHKLNESQVQVYEINEDVFFTQLKDLSKGLAPLECKLLETTNYKHSDSIDLTFFQNIKD